MTTKILIGDALETLKTLPDESVHCCITSPPYWGLRNYGTAEWEGGEAACLHLARSSMLGGPPIEFEKTCGWCGAIRVDKQMGLEPTPELFLSNMVTLFREVRRVLRSDGTLFCNMGDSYQDKQLMGMPWRLALALQQPHLQCNGCGNVAHKSAWGHFPNGRLICPACELSKGWTVAEQGWWLRQDIIWAKPNPMPESVTDRCTKAHEYVFLLTKSARYYYDNDAVREGEKVPGASAKQIANQIKRRQREAFNHDDGVHNMRGESYLMCDGTSYKGGRNRRSVWTIATQPFSAAHFATFPTKLVEPMIKAGTSEKGCCPECGGPWKRVTESEFFTQPDIKDPAKLVRSTAALDPSSSWGNSRRGSNSTHTTGWKPTCDHDRAPIPCTVLDPFAGACTVGLVADRLGRDSIMIELNPEYAAMGEKRINDDAGWVADVEVVDDGAPVQLELI